MRGREEKESEKGGEAEWTTPILRGERECASVISRNGRWSKEDTNESGKKERRKKLRLRGFGWSQVSLDTNWSANAQAVRKYGKLTAVLKLM